MTMKSMQDVYAEMLADEGGLTGKETDEISKLYAQILSGEKQFFDAATDMARNYIDMRIDKTVGGDDYFHCKANYEATDRGKIGEKTAKALGDFKELCDYYRNQYVKGFTKQKAYEDYIHDKHVNEVGRQQAKSGLYSSSKDGCQLYRVEGINDRY